MINETEKLAQEYNRDFTDIIEWLYGESLLSQGGYENIDRMFLNENLNNKTLLEIGSGLGGVSLYLAEKYQINIVGIDRVSRLVEESKKRQTKKNLIGKVDFKCSTEENSLANLDNDYFDFVIAKEVMLHVVDKKSFLQEINNKLKPGGKIIFIDWLSERIKLGPNISKMLELDDLKLHIASKDDYTSFFQESNFIKINVESLNSEYIKYSNDNINYLLQNKENFIHKFGEENYNVWLESIKYQANSFIDGEIDVSLITAEKICFCPDSNCK